MIFGPLARSPDPLLPKRSWADARREDARSRMNSESNSESNKEDRAAQLSKVAPFDLLAPDELREMLGVCEEIVLEAGAVVFQAGDPAEALYLVLSGRLKVWSGGEEGAAIADLPAGDLFGERALILGE